MNKKIQSVAYGATEKNKKQAKNQNKGVFVKTIALSFALAAFGFNANAQIGAPAVTAEQINTALGTAKLTKIQAAVTALA